LKLDQIPTDIWAAVKQIKDSRAQLLAKRVLPLILDLIKNYLFVLVGILFVLIKNQLISYYAIKVYGTKEALNIEKL